MNDYLILGIGVICISSCLGIIIIAILAITKLGKQTVKSARQEGEADPPSAKKMAASVKQN